MSNDQLPSGVYCWCLLEGKLNKYTIWYLTPEAAEKWAENKYFYSDIGAIVDYQDHPRMTFMANEIASKRIIHAFTLADAYCVVEFENGQRDNKPKHKVTDENGNEIYPCQSIPNKAILDLQAEAMAEFEKRFNRPSKFREIAPGVYLPKE